MPECHTKAAKTDRMLSATDGLMASIIGPVGEYVDLQLADFGVDSITGGVITVVLLFPEAEVDVFSTFTFSFTFMATPADLLCSTFAVFPTAFSAFNDVVEILKTCGSFWSVCDLLGLAVLLLAVTAVTAAAGGPVDIIISDFNDTGDKDPSLPPRLDKDTSLVTAPPPRSTGEVDNIDMSRVRLEIMSEVSEAIEF